MQTSIRLSIFSQPTFKAFKLNSPANGTYIVLRLSSKTLALSSSLIHGQEIVAHLRPEGLLDKLA
jgi:hypothetical protein